MTHMTHFPIEAVFSVHSLVKRMRHGATCVMVESNLNNSARGRIAFIFEGSRTTGALGCLRVFPPFLNP
jgi:hypothetical protein